MVGRRKVGAEEGDTPVVPPADQSLVFIQNNEETAWALGPAACTRRRGGALADDEAPGRWL